MITETSKNGVTTLSRMNFSGYAERDYILFSA